MAAGGFEGTPEQFTAAENNVTDVRVAMDQRLSQLQGEIEATRAGWDGDAAKAFNHVMQRFDESGKGLNKALQTIADLLQDAGSKYQRTEAEQNEIVSSFNKGFGVLG
ncbi:WXG100 family type VII secretion target [Amycolatopsis rhabdoformis]|uniref:ESAT-6-like protein n=1 Tax=Amycolatopsis rhabdoformis TaxID=1448059 RepID=A0ABZ1I441_9PSEU|nr:WXG100 family type VII secretion target [Amycolatopsis rhabdoformis]WSE29157.1 WXG100 family type VII secretion target [Amycolatopsis rhabdoformis]